MGLDEFILQQDNDPKHTSNVVKDWFDEKNIDVLPWLPQSPDMNPIEHIWVYMKMCLRGKGKLNKKILKKKLLKYGILLHLKWLDYTFKVFINEF
ncbi:TCB2 [Hepatospora eriocheir]|uniref:TCB2 n=1 Tax=Hepatospora eriocheir TaxID=1081669 RepID=A0A1X0QGU3_9MICR|nr:TCB2 [Hepatospora eriocheir]